MRKESLWIEGTEPPPVRALDGDSRADVCVVGAGIAGLSAAYHLAKAGKSVIVLDDGEIGQGMTGVTTAHLTCALDRRYEDIERIHGMDGARLAAESHMAAIDRIEAVIENEEIECDFARVTGYLFCAPDDDETNLPRELSAMKRAGIGDAYLSERAPLHHFDTGPCVTLPRQAQFHPLKYLTGIARSFCAAGGEIYCHAHADTIEGGEVARVRAGRHTIEAAAVIVATNAPINDRLVIHTKQAPYMTYVIAAAVEPGSVPLGLYWDTLEAYHYVRMHPHKGQEYLIVGGEDHKSGQASDTAERHQRLEDWARQRFPTMRPIEYVWAGQVMQSVDGLAYIGRNPLDRDNVYVVTGDTGMGMTHGTIAGMLLTDLILERPNPWEVLYEPSRKRIGAAGTLMKEAANMAAQFGDWVKPNEVASRDQIANGYGAVIRDGLGMIAAYRDSKGELHETTAVCNHLGCIVHWNVADSTWDCPCHGSRFDKYGRVLNGPANRDLKPLRTGKLEAG
jgi:glycine/D-amino acid oxidase-like deaminating enzyme/nitrite reductase/ring-hydroxylating ferredoxin subunit